MSTPVSPTLFARHAISFVGSPSVKLPCANDIDPPLPAFSCIRSGKSSLFEPRLRYV
jgi:hypothetical protein